MLFLISTDTKILLYVIFIFYVIPIAFISFSLYTRKLVTAAYVVSIVWNILVLPFALFCSIYTGAIYESFFAFIGTFLWTGGFPILILILIRNRNTKIRPNI